MEILYYRKYPLNYRLVNLKWKKMFATATFNPEPETLIVHLAILSIGFGNKMHTLKKTQIAHLKVDEFFIEVSSKYTDFADIFFSMFAVVLLENTRINDYAIGFLEN